MVSEKIKQEVEKLRKEIEYHNYRYYVLAQPVISDEEYDKLMKRLMELEEKYPELKTPDSPTQRVGGQLIEGFETVEHSEPMLSLDNTYNENEIRNFHERIRKVVRDVQYVAELKIDGVSIALRYENGLLVRAITRGDGLRGDDVTANVKTVKSIPLRLPEPLTIEVRGEIFMPVQYFEEFNRQREEEGLLPFANPRNATAGTLHLLDPSQVAQRKLDSFMYYIVKPQQYDLKTQWDALKFLEKLHFKVNPHSKLLSSIEEVIDYWKEWTEKRKKLEYWIDGVVVKVNDFEQQNELGWTAKSPRWAIAFKFPAQQVRTKVLNITFQVGRTGTITPVAEFEPVELEGSIVKRASLHNFDYIKENDIRVGDYVFIEKAGGIIPQISYVLKELRDGDEIETVPPEKCPECGGPVGKESGEYVAYKCLNPHCPAKLKRHIEVFVSRQAMDIQGLGPKIISKIVDAGLVKDIADLYYLNIFDLAQISGLGPKMISNILSEIEKSKQNPIEKLLVGLGIPGVGEKIAKVLAKKYKSMEELSKADIKELSEIEGIGEDIAKNIVEYFNSPKTKEILEKLRKAGVNLESAETTTSNILDGLTFCVTGTLENFSREEIKRFIESLGGHFTDNLTKKTDYLLVGTNPGSKLEKAKKFGVKVLNEQEFLEMLEKKGVELKESWKKPKPKDTLF
ncbi:NAD-dependent DNA ligase LigA [Fervidobacterium nodosum]|uniref:DNA ligase n=1 Tax=Fervidobacterium nodosum (strain ATCC 35602 / DSM 5306 / Rt17-B1) TaxID=381764 RepID=DNLJ_FERNB|nr:NAD-dependent DNA ligase LigA [Fervidobacterium nodosum]A7HJG6.1 RecName: Full=DNA ligase; AltName: Full=Polydeoxyribonucleotide synthase [NAD(+)] [Fervidobacterium nodosum Rt17-B1]ABS60049.1 DNA ligase, NAD-dependent [Fervidobacterium nodosum Rt17-B1]PHJ13278.1 NAD-dependent DNA ligase LigA [Fervidobacterium sp. SC_NGM5_G05]